MDNNTIDEPMLDGPVLKVESVSAVFAHDISTPLTTAIMNTNLLVEHIDLLHSMLSKEEAKKIPQHIKLAIERAPQHIQDNILAVQKSLREYKAYLNCIKSDGTYQQTKTPTGEPASIKSLNILIVDDEEIHHDISKAVLGDSHTVAHDSSGVKAIERCKTEEFDIILMDMQMPELSGPQTAEQLRAILKNPTLIIGLSNMPIQSKKQEMLDCGFNGFLDKPLRLGDFNRLISSLAKISN